MSLKGIEEIFEYTKVGQLSYQSIYQHDITELVQGMIKLRKRIVKDSYQDEELIEMVDLLKGYMNDMTSCLVPYSQVILDIEEIKRVVGRTIRHYPAYKEDCIVVVEAIRKLHKVEENELLKELIKLIRQNPNKKIAIVSKYNLTVRDREEIKKLVPVRMRTRSLNFYNDNTYRRVDKRYDIAIFLKSEKVFVFVKRNWSQNALENGSTLSQKFMTI